MKKIKALILATACMTIFASCSSDDKGPEINKDEVAFTASLVDIDNANQDTKAESAWTKGGKMGISMLKSDNKLIKGNTCYILNEDGNIKASKTGLAFPKGETSVNYVSYLPFKESCDGKSVSLDISNQEKLTNADFLYSRNAINKKLEDKEVNLKFYHALSLLTLDVESNKEMKFYIETSTKASFNLINGKVENLSEKKEVALNDNRIILFPGDKDCKLIVKTEYEKGEISLSEILKYIKNNPIEAPQSGKHYNIKIKVLKDLEIKEISESNWIGFDLSTIDADALSVEGLMGYDFAVEGPQL